MPKKSAGIVAFRVIKGVIEVLLVHPGGPFYAKKDLGVWSIPKGEYADNEVPLEVAKREFQEETGNLITGQFIPLGEIKMKSGKIVTAWAIETNFDKCFISSNTFEMEWPPNSGIKQAFPEVDRAEWFTLNAANDKLLPAQKSFLEKITTLI